MAQRKQIPLRLDPAVHDALARWAADELRSVNAQIELLLRDALRQAGRMPREARPVRPRGRPRRDADEPDDLRGGRGGADPRDDVDQRDDAGLRGDAGPEPADR